MTYIKCPYCCKSDGNNERVVFRRILYVDNIECVIVEAKECDICGKRDYVEKNYKFDYERLNDGNFEE